MVVPDDCGVGNARHGSTIDAEGTFGIYISAGRSWLYSSLPHELGHTSAWPMPTARTAR
ncbi:hypothetical protein [Naumannella halotolerans]|uniref:Uncharacterized protein n=1 Tax=Naumannella halotolerans TaxID=993414 RepID=A0A4R7JBB7_9ACTN|nr:hypothetical protein [Naumannella halotolerans]TDT34256.1 hypothetical protein CLV29_1914 [Naumannella halotolerans]